MCHLSCDNSSLIFLFLGLSICSLPVPLSWWLDVSPQPWWQPPSHIFLSSLGDPSFFLSCFLSTSAIFLWIGTSCHLLPWICLFFIVCFFSSHLHISQIHICPQNGWKQMGENYVLSQRAGWSPKQCIDPLECSHYKKKSHLNMYRLGCIIYI